MSEDKNKEIQKKKYASPELIVHGDIKKLTTGGSGSQPEAFPPYAWANYGGSPPP